MTIFSSSMDLLKAENHAHLWTYHLWTNVIDHSQWQIFMDKTLKKMSLTMVNDKKIVIYWKWSIHPLRKERDGTGGRAGIQGLRSEPPIHSWQAVYTLDQDRPLLVPFFCFIYQKYHNQRPREHGHEMCVIACNFAIMSIGRSAAVPSENTHYHNHLNLRFIIVWPRGSNEVYLQNISQKWPRVRSGHYSLIF